MAYVDRHPWESCWGCLGEGCEGGLEGLNEGTWIRGVQGLECGHRVREYGDAAQGFSTGGEEPGDIICHVYGHVYAAVPGIELSAW